MKRASEVPPLVEKTGAVPVTLGHRVADQLGEFARLGQERDAADAVRRPRSRSRFPWRCWSARSVTQPTRLSGVCWSLKRMLKAARASPGITLVASIADIDAGEGQGRGSKWSLPLSSLCAGQLRHQFAPAPGIGFFAFCG